MIDKLKEQIINDKDLGLTQFQIDYLVDKLNKINVYFEVVKYEVETAIEDVANDDLYRGYEEKLYKLSNEDINRIAWKVYDYDIWNDIYEFAREEVIEQVGGFEREEEENDN